MPLMLPHNIYMYVSFILKSLAKLACSVLSRGLCGVLGRGSGLTIIYCMQWMVDFNYILDRKSDATPFSQGLHR